MYTGMVHLHNVLRWVILILLLLAVFRHMTAGNRLFSATDKRISLFTMISCDITMLVGLYLYFVGPWGYKLIQAQGFGEVMKNAVSRFFAIEHLLGMIIAIVLVHLGSSYAKRNVDDRLKHKRVLLFFGLALLIILISIPWPFRTVGAGRGWLPGM